MSNSTNNDRNGQTEQTFTIRDNRESKYYFIDTIFIKGGYGAYLGAHGIAVYNALAACADNNTQEAYPSHQKIAMWINCSRRQVQREMSKLVELNIIRIEHRFSERGDPTSNLVTLIHRDEWKPAPLPEKKTRKKPINRPVDSQGGMDSQTIPMDSQTIPMDSESHKLSSLNLTPKKLTSSSSCEPKKPENQTVGKKKKMHDDDDEIISLLHESLDGYGFDRDGQYKVINTRKGDLLSVWHEHNRYMTYLDDGGDFPSNLKNKKGWYITRLCKGDIDTYIKPVPKSLGEEQIEYWEKMGEEPTEPGVDQDWLNDQFAAMRERLEDRQVVAEY